jgi:hypothetical protein
MTASEYVLRFLAFYHRGAGYFMDKYHGRKAALSAFFNDEMLYWQDNWTKEAKDVMASRFLQAADLSRQVFGSMVFSKTDSDKGAISALAYEVLMVGFALYSKDAVLAKKAQIRQRFLDLCANDREFRFGMDRATTEAARVNARHSRWGQTLLEILGADAALPPTILGNPVSMIPVFTMSLDPPAKRAKPAKVQKAVVQTDLLAGAANFIDPEDDPTAQVASELEAEPLPLAVKELVQVVDLPVEVEVAQELSTWPVEQRLCDKCKSPITDAQLATIVCKVPDVAPGEERLASVTHGPGECNPVWMAAAMAAPAVGAIV